MLQAMALMELKTAVALLCSKFSFRLADDMGGAAGVIASEVMALTLHAKNGIRMHCVPRQSASASIMGAHCSHS